MIIWGLSLDLGEDWWGLRGGFPYPSSALLLAPWWHICTTSLFFFIMAALFVREGEGLVAAARFRVVEGWVCWKSP